MGISLGALIGAAATGTSGYMAGRQQRTQRDQALQRQQQQDALAEEERRLRMEALAQQIQQAQIPQPRQPITVAPGSTLVDPATGQPIYSAPDRTAPDRPVSPVSLSPGQVLVDPSTGKPIYRNPALPKEPTGPNAGPPAESERRAAGLLMGAQQALDDIHGLLKRGYDPTKETLGSRLAAGTGFPKLATATASTEGRLFRNAVKRLVTNYLYVTSGATANPGEIASQAEQTTADILDNPETLDQKLRFLDGKVEEMRAMAGRAAPPSAPAGGMTPAQKAFADWQARQGGQR